MRVLPNSSRLKLRVSFTRIHVLKTDYVCKWPQPWGQRDRRDFRSQPLMTCYSRSITGCRSNDRHDLLTSDPWPAVNKNSHNWTGEELFSKMEIYEQPMRRRQFYFKCFFIKIRIFFLQIFLWESNWTKSLVLYTLYIYSFLFICTCLVSVWCHGFITKLRF